MGKLAFIFPGQGAQYIGMGKDFYKEFPICRQTIEKAAEISKLDLEKICFEENEKISITEYTQIAMTAVEAAIFKALEEKGFYPDMTGRQNLRFTGRLNGLDGEALEKRMQADSSLGWKHWLTLIFPAAVLAVFAVYIVLVLKSHRLKGFNVTKRNAQKLYDMYALCASLCKIPALMFISEMMMITHNNMLMADEGWFTLQLVLDLLIIAILICLFRHLMQKMTEPEVHEESTAVRMTAVVKEEPAVPSEAPETNDTTERS